LTAATTWKEGRRLRAWQLHLQGWSHRLLADALGVSQAAISQWIAAANESGVEGLRAHSRRGQGSRLSVVQRPQRPALLQRGAEAYNFVDALWTCRRIALVIEREFGRRYHPGHVSRLLHALRWTYQTPVLRTSQRDEERIQPWLSNDWPALKKQPRARAEPPSSSTNRGSS
jgi:transposase